MFLLKLIMQFHQFSNFWQLLIYRWFINIYFLLKSDPKVFFFIFHSCLKCSLIIPLVLSTVIQQVQHGNSSPNTLYSINGTVIVFKTRSLQVTPQALPLHSHFLTNAASCVLNNFCLPSPYFNYLLSAPCPDKCRSRFSGFHLSCRFAVVFIC